MESDRVFKRLLPVTYPVGAVEDSLYILAILHEDFPEGVQEIGHRLRPGANFSWTVSCPPIFFFKAYLTALQNKVLDLPSIFIDDFLTFYKSRDGSANTHIHQNKLLVCDAVRKS